VSADATHPWDQQPDEPDAAYARFLLYRNLGPSRSIDAAYRLLHPTKNGEKGRRNAHGSWHQEGQAFRWTERASAWDIHYLQTAGSIAIARFIALLSELAVRALRALEESDARPETWQDVLDTVQTLGQYLPPETLLAVARRDAG
jgi:hypothetical protein